jgi:hypothetical protein
MSGEKFNAIPVKGETYKADMGKEKDMFPFKEGVEGTSTFSVVSAPIDSDPKSARSFHLNKLSDSHGRDFEVEEAKAIWGDEFGNIYGSINIKGNNMENLEMVINYESVAGFKVRGLLHETDIPRIVEASRLLRSHNIDTEKIERCIKPNELVVKGKRMTMEQIKEMLLHKAATESEEDIDLEKAKKFLQQEEFYFAVRSFQVSERVSDLAEQDETTIKPFMSKIFSFINMRESIEAGREGRSAEHFDAKNDEDIARYFREYLPKRIALNLAKFHSLGISHRFLHNQNISMAGGIYDLASARGKGLRESDETVTAKDIRTDFGEFFYGLTTIADPGKYIKLPEEKRKEQQERSYINFYKTYLDNALNSLMSMNILPPPPDFREFQYKAVETIAEEISQNGSGNTENIPDFSQKIRDQFSDKVFQWLSTAIMFPSGSLLNNRKEVVKDAAEKIATMSSPLSPQEVHDLLMEKLRQKAGG